MARDVLPLVEDILGKRACGSRTPSGGHSSAVRLIVELDDGSSCFVKAATNDRSAQWLRSEYHLIYSQLAATFVPRMLGWADDGDRPFLILEDLSNASWPPPWTRSRVEQVLHTLKDVRRATVHGAPAVTPVQGRNLDLGWQTVRTNPAPFLSLGLCTKGWLGRALPSLIDAAADVTIDGDDLVHYDVRSDNLCFAGDRVVLVDWNWTVRGNGDLDLAFWLPSLVAEGGAVPEQLMPDAPGWAALVSGYYAARAPIQSTPGTAGVRARQLQWLIAVLPWAARTLGLALPNGPADNDGRAQE